MLPSSRHAGRCIYCAFRNRQQLLQSRRIRHSNFHTSTPNNARIRYTSNDPPDHSRPKSVSRKGEQYAGRTSDDGNIRKFLFGRQHEPYIAADFSGTLRVRLQVMKEELKDVPLLEQLREERQAESEKPESFEKIWRSFVKNVPTGEKRPFFGTEIDQPESKKIMKDLRDAFNLRGQRGLDNRIKYNFYAHLTGARFTSSDIKNQQTLADLRYPSEWFPATRAMSRTIHLHVGPTNSGKTYHALQRLEQADTGVYAGPLRLLAHEVYTRMNAKGKPCALVTGEERRKSPEEDNPGLGSMYACTVEMMPLNKTIDVAVIDEIQMIGNAERGWAWTQALLGVKAKEVHLCGEERTVPLIREICAALGEKLEIHHYERLSPLKVAEESLDGDLSKLQKGDCIVSFSVMGIHALRKQIERRTGKKVATVYGSLPPETRAQQARLFNDPNNDYDYLVASDAVGMGLNLAIKRMIFEASTKFDGYQRRTLGIADIKQIAGRAGRYRTAAQVNETPVSAQDLAAAKGESPGNMASENIGLVTTLEKFDYPIVSAAMQAEAEPIRTAGIFPPAPIVERFASYFPPGTPFSYILVRLHELSQMHPRFHLCGLKDQIWIADLIEPIQTLTIADRNIISSCPASMVDEELWRRLMPAFARCIAEQRGGDIIDIEEMPLEMLEADVSASREYLRELERLHKGVVAYLWLSYRFAGIFGTRAVAFHVKELVEEKIEQVLGQFSFSEASYRKLALKREKELLLNIESAVAGSAVDESVEEAILPEEDGIDPSAADGGLGAGTEQLLHQQTTLSSGGDHFAGEQDIDIGLADPAESHLANDHDLASKQPVRGPRPTGQNQFGSTIPSKHLSHLDVDVNASEMERNVESRP